MRCVRIAGSDDRMDCRDMFWDPINPLPARCPKCGFPHLDHVPQPYVLVKSRAMSPNELAMAENGNFFARQRARQVLDLLAPGQCTWYPTCFRGTSEQTPWLLGVPNRQVETARVDPSIPRCDACGEPRSAHPGSQYCEFLFGKPLRNDQSPGTNWTDECSDDVLKSSTWGSSEDSWKKWISRDLFLSLRMLHLFKKIKLKGFYETTCGKETVPSKNEVAWIDEQLQILKTAGIPLHAEGTLSNEDSSWLREYIKTNRLKEPLNFDFKAVEKRLQKKLPKSYQDFVKKVGPVSFDNVDEQEGFTASIMTPDELGIEGYSDDFDDEESRAVNGLMFARTEHGDSFCFDVQKEKKEFQVFLFKHEYYCLEPYAENFAACIRRFAGG